MASREGRRSGSISTERSPRCDSVTYSIHSLRVVDQVEVLGHFAKQVGDHGAQGNPAFLDRLARQA